MNEASVTLSAVRRRVMAMFFVIILAVVALIGRLAWLQTVSYTHLDVYKRQLLKYQAIQFH